MKLGHYDRKMLRNPAEYDYLNQSDQTTSTAVCVIDDASTCLRTRDCLTAADIDFAEILQHGSRIHPALPQLFFHQRQIIPNEIQIEHGIN